MSNTITREDAATAMREVGLGDYTGYADYAADLVNAGRSADQITAYAASRGVRLNVGTVEAFLRNVGSQSEEATATEGEAAEGFDREHAAGVLREFAASRGANMDEVEAVLEVAGLVDPQPEPEPEAEVASDGGLGDIARRIEATLNSLVAFARQHGYRG